MDGIDYDDIELDDEAISKLVDEAPEVFQNPILLIS